MAPGLHEVARFEVSGDAPATRTLVDASAGDVCARAAVVAWPQVHLALVDAHGVVLADAPDAGDTALAPRGPVCVRRGDTISLRIDASVPFTARVVAWASR
jgi:hypothetical protein